MRGGGVDTSCDDARAGDDTTAERAIDRQGHVSRQLSDGNHVRRFLQLDDLRIDEGALVVDDDVRVNAACTALLAFDARRVAVSWKREVAKAAVHSDVLGVAAVAAHDVQCCSAGGGRAGCNDDTRNSDEARDRIGVQVSHAEQVCR